MSSSATRRGHQKRGCSTAANWKKNCSTQGAVTITVPVLSEFVKLRLAKLEADHQRGIPFNEAIGNDALGLDIMARGVLQDWLATMFNQYDQIAAKLLPAVEAASIKPKIVPPIGEPLSAKRGAKVNLTELKGGVMTEPNLFEEMLATYPAEKRELAREVYHRFADGDSTQFFTQLFLVLDVYAHYAERIPGSDDFGQCRFAGNRAGNTRGNQP